MKDYYIFSHGNIILADNGESLLTIPHSEQPPFPYQEMIQLPEMQGREAWALDVEDNLEPPAGFRSMSLRSSFKFLSADDYQNAGKAEELLHWHQSTRYCGHCGAPMEFSSPISKVCKNCHQEIWPTLSPAIIVLIRKGRDEILLVQSRSFKSDYYGLVAGFVETGESLEECVYREVCEETGLKITNLRYFGSQPWPYPRGLMLGFTADYLSGNLHLQFSELNKGGWFRRGQLPTIPEKLSMARKLIDDWIENPPMEE